MVEAGWQSGENTLGTVVIRCEEPAVAGLRRTAQQAEFVVAQYALRTASRHKRSDEANDARTVGTPVTQVADEDKMALIRMRAVLAVAQPGEKVVQGLELAVDVTDDIERSGQQGGGK